MNHVVKIWRFFLDSVQILAIENLKKKTHTKLNFSTFNVNISFLAIYISQSGPVPIGYKGRKLVVGGGACGLP